MEIFVFWNHQMLPYCTGCCEVLLAKSVNVYAFVSGTFDLFNTVCKPIFERYEKG